MNTIRKINEITTNLQVIDNNIINFPQHRKQKQTKKQTIIELKNQSCFEYLKSLPSGSIDLVLIDPPYEISKETGFSKGGGVDRFAVSMDFGEWDKEFSGLDDVLEQAYRVLKKGGTFICFYDLWKITPLKTMMEEVKFKQIRFIEWVKTNPVPLNSKINYLTGAREIAVVGIKGSKPTFKSEYDNGIYSYPIYHDKERFHPTQKPVDLIASLIEKHSNENDTVLDCFSGSGTTALAAIKTNRHFKGCEFDPTYHQKSIQRLEKWDRQITIIEE